MTPSMPHSPNHALDRFAQTYIPNWQRYANTQAPHGTFEQRAPIIPLHQCFDSIYPPTLLKMFANEDIEISKACAHIIQAVKSRTIDVTKPMAALSLDNYARRLIPLLFAEFEAKTALLKSANLYAVPLKRETKDVYSFDALAIREGWPPVDIGDSICLRQLRPYDNSFQGILFIAVVQAINRSAGKVYVTSEALGGYIETLIFNIEFIPQAKTTMATHRAIEILETYLSTTEDPSERIKSIPGVISLPKQLIKEVHLYGPSAANNWLFPKAKRRRPRTPVADQLPLVWIAADLNAEQKGAVQEIVYPDVAAPPFLISGPPGTGKTKTIVEAVLQILRVHPNARCLVCGTGNPSADTLVLRLRRHLQYTQLFRLNDSGRPLSEVRSEITPYCYIDEDGRFALPAPSVLLQARVIVTSCADAVLLSQARLTNRHYQRLFDLNESLLPMYAQRSARIPLFSHLLIDEAGCATEAETCIPLSVVLPYNRSGGAGSRMDREMDAWPTITLCGDVKQLGPRIIDEHVRTHNLGVSLLERLFELPLYANHPLARKNLKGLAPSKVDQIVKACQDPSSTANIPKAYFATLRQNYRSHQSFVMIPSTLFYSDSLIPSASHAIQHTPLTQWSNLLNSSMPYLFIGLDSQEDMLDEGSSWFNHGEIDQVLFAVQSLLSEKIGDLLPKQISIISPFREQVWRIRLALRKLGLGEVDVGNVEALQGAENRVVIISTVRSNPRFLPQDAKSDLGLIMQPQRFNVAITRAQELMIIVGNANTLAIDPYWRSLLCFCLRHNLYTGPEIKNMDPVSVQVGAISRLEERWLKMHSHHQNGRKNSRSTINEDEEEEHDIELLTQALAGSLIRDLGHWDDD